MNTAAAQTAYADWRADRITTREYEHALRLAGYRRTSSLERSSRVPPYLPIETSVRDVALDIVAALDTYEGLIGSETTTLEVVSPGLDGTVVLVLSNGDEYRLRVELIREAS